MVSLIEKWRSRHAYPDAVGMWAIATGAEARALAFNAIAQDPRVLQRAARPQAIKMAAQAEAFAQSLAEPSVAGSELWRAVALFVQRSIDAWRHSLKAFDRCADGVGTFPLSTIVRPHSCDPWETALRNFPHVDDATGRLATRLLHEFGSPLLRRTRKPWDHVIALAVLRFAARLLRGELAESEQDGDGASAVADVLNIQSYAGASGLSPMLVGYSGPGKPAAQALGLFRDARTLRDAVRVAEAGGEARAAAWQRAIDFHAFAVVALDHRILLDLPLDDAYELAAAAIRQAEAAKQTPNLVEMPRMLPDGASEPEIVRLYASACLPPNDADPTRQSRRDGILGGTEHRPDRGQPGTEDL
jgi:hypothetical protein